MQWFSAWYGFRFHLCASLPWCQCGFWHHRSLYTPEWLEKKIVFFQISKTSLIQRHQYVSHSNIISASWFSFPHSHGVKFHCYVDATQQYVPVKAHFSDHRLQNGWAKYTNQSWMRASLLHPSLCGIMHPLPTPARGWSASCGRPAD